MVNIYNFGEKTISINLTQSFYFLTSSLCKLFLSSMGKMGFSMHLRAFISHSKRMKETEPIYRLRSVAR